MNTTKKEKYIPLSTKVIEVHGELGFCETADLNGPTPEFAVKKWEKSWDDPSSNGEQTSSAGRRGW